MAENKNSIDTEVNKTMMNLVNTIIERRKELGLEQKDIAKQTNNFQASISRIENLTNVPKLNTLIKILNCLGLELTIKVKEDK